MITQAKTDSLYKQLSVAFEQQSADAALGALGPIRKAAFDRFLSTGFPTVKNEDWKYSNVAPLVNDSYALEADTVQGVEAALSKAKIPALEAYRIVLVNGVFVPELSDEPTYTGLDIKPIHEAYGETDFTEHFAQHADKTDNPFVALNTAISQHGLFLKLDRNVVIDKPIHIVHVASSSNPLFTAVRNLFVLEANAEAEIIETFVAAEGNAKTLNNHVTEVALAENAKLQHYYLQRGDNSGHYINHCEVYQAKHSLYNNYNCTLPGASFVRNDINVRLDDETVESHLYGVTLTSDKQHVDNHTIVDHMKPHCESYEWYKNILQDSSTAVFNGKIFVREDAQKTNAFQQNNNILLDEHASIYTKPQLEIFADDVKCSHGCTIGQFDEEGLFYLRTRGIGEEEARILMVHAFAFDVTTRFSNEHVRMFVEELVEDGLKS